MNWRNRLRPAALAAAVCLTLAAATAAGAQEAQPRAYSESPLARPTGYVSDVAEVIDAATEERLEALLTELKTAGNIEFAVVTVPTTGDAPIFDYTLSVARGWGIGAKEAQSKGAILLVAVNDRKYNMQVSRHLEGDLPDGLIGEVLRQKLREPFRAGQYGRGITDAVQTFAATLAEKQGFTLGGAGREQAYRPPVRQTREPRTNARRTAGGFDLGTCCCGVAFLGLIIVTLLGQRGGGGRGGRGGRGGWGGGGLLNALLVANVLSSLGGGGRRGGGGWGGFGGGGGGGSGWGGGGFGGFGGGGDFGGGGAGGDW